LTLGVQGALGATLVVGALLKLAGGPAHVTRVLNWLGWFPPQARPAAAAALPWAELLLAAWVVSGRRPRWAAMAVVAVLTVFILALVQVGLSVGWSRECGCLGSWDGSSVAVAVVRNGVLLCLAIGLAAIAGGGGNRSGLGTARPDGGKQAL